MMKGTTAIILNIFLLCTLSAGCQRDNKEETPEEVEYKPDPATIVVYVPDTADEFIEG